jgi:hypothetical protein
MLLFDLSALAGGAAHAPLHACLLSLRPDLPAAAPARKRAPIEMRWLRMPGAPRPQAHWVRTN